jgi:hypothetical protein
MGLGIIFRKVKLFVQIALLFILLVILFFYLTTPIYQFNEPQKFQGDYLHNPYQQIDSTHWLKYNFQVQSRAWGGLTDGRINSNQMIDSIYKLFGYNYVATSDYQRINTHLAGTERFIPTYEHGYNIPKVHQVCIGAKRVLWRDYLLFQTLNTKQHIINVLRSDCELIALAHPRLLDGYTLNDMKYLSGYDLLEVLNNFRVSVEHWDMALSSGHLIYILANDDAHNVLNSNEVGRRFTLIHANSTHHDSIIKALRSGAAYGVDFYRNDDEPMQNKIERSKFIPFLKRAKLFGDTLKIGVSNRVFHIRFVGEQGTILSEVDHVSDAQYVINANDSYVRVEIQCYDASVLYLNPVTRHMNRLIEKQISPQIDHFRTWIIRLIIILLLASTIVLYRIYRNKKTL